MRAVPWVAGLLRRSPLAVLATAVSVALAIGLIGALGSFVAATRADLTLRAAAGVPVDWQVQLTADADRAAVARAVADLPDVRSRADVGSATVPALATRSALGVRTTGAARILSLPRTYARQFPGEIRPLVGAEQGVLLAQQTAANLAVAPGDDVTVTRPGGTTVRLRVDGVVELPAADAFFQVVGAPAAAGATAPPDNVVLLPPERFSEAVGTATIVRQIHLGFDHRALPADPGAAYDLITRREKALQVDVAGGALVADNLLGALDGAREEALYALLLVLLLGVPGVVLAAVVSALVVALRGERRRRDYALLRIRGASAGVVVRLVVAEAAVTSGLAILLGLPLATVAVRWALSGQPGGGGAGLGRGPAYVAATVGVLIALATQLVPVLGPALRGDGPAVREDAIAAPPSTDPWPLRAGLDGVLLVTAALVTWLTARGGNHLVLAAEGAARTSVNYAALLGPALAWPGLALLTWRVVGRVLGRRTGRFARSGGGRVPELTAAVVRRRRQVVARGATGLAIALGLAASTAVFTATYDRQAGLDVALTVGADVAVTTPPSVTFPVDIARTIDGAPGSGSVEAMLHRFAYVGPDLQDIYGVHAATIARSAPLLDSYTPGTTVARVLATLEATADGVLVSAETLHDYQLHPGDLVRLRLQTGPGRTYRPVDFHVVGEVTEFPTAPKDSFIVANAAYLSQQSGSDEAGTYLVTSRSPAATSAALRTALRGSGAVVQDIVSARSSVGTVSGLAGSDLRGLARLELAFGLTLAMASSGLALLVGADRLRRTLVLLSALGADARQRTRFVAAEAWVLLVAGLLGGAVVTGVISYLLITVLTGIFDPAPTGPALPVGYLAALVAAVVAATSAAAGVVTWVGARSGPSSLRDL